MVGGVGVYMKYAANFAGSYRLPGMGVSIPSEFNIIQATISRHVGYLSLNLSHE